MLRPRFADMFSLQARVRASGLSFMNTGFVLVLQKLALVKNVIFCTQTRLNVIAKIPILNYKYLDRVHDDIFS